jgi:hypothetical protein
VDVRHDPSLENSCARVYARSCRMRAMKKQGAPCGTPFHAWASTEGIDLGPEVALGIIRPLVVFVRWIWDRNYRHDDRHEAHERLPERNESSSLSGGVGSLLSGENWEGKEGKEEEDQEGTRTGARCLRHGRSLSG